MSFVDENRLSEGVDEDSVDVEVETSYINDKVDGFLLFKDCWCTF